MAWSVGLRKKIDAESDKTVWGAVLSTRIVTIFDNFGTTADAFNSAKFEFDQWRSLILTVGRNFMLPYKSEVVMHCTATQACDARRLQQNTCIATAWIAFSREFYAKTRFQDQFSHMTKRKSGNFAVKTDVNLHVIMRLSSRKMAAMMTISARRRILS